MNSFILWCNFISLLYATTIYPINNEADFLSKLSSLSSESDTSIIFDMTSSYEFSFTDMIIVENIKNYQTVTFKSSDGSNTGTTVDTRHGIIFQNCANGGTVSMKILFIGCVFVENINLNNYGTIQGGIVYGSGSFSNYGSIQSNVNCPSLLTSSNPTAKPINSPNPSLSPTKKPSKHPTFLPTLYPTSVTAIPTLNPTTNSPTTNLTTNSPTTNPTTTPTLFPLINPTNYPAQSMTNTPTNFPTQSTNIPTKHPTKHPSTPNPTLFINKISTPSSVTQVSIYNSTKIVQNIKNSNGGHTTDHGVNGVIIAGVIGVICIVLLVLMFIIRKLKNKKRQYYQKTIQIKMTQVASITPGYVPPKPTHVSKANIWNTKGNEQSKNQDEIDNINNNEKDMDIIHAIDATAMREEIDDISVLDTNFTTENESNDDSDSRQNITQTGETDM